MEMMRSREQEEFERFFDHLFPRARALGYRILGDPTAADEVAAEALARTYARWPKVQSVPHLEGWVLRVAGNLAVEAVRRRPPALPQSGRRRRVAAVRTTLTTALGALPPLERDTVMLRYLTELADWEVAAVLGLDQDDLREQLERGLALMRAEVGPALKEGSLAGA